MTDRLNATLSLDSEIGSVKGVSSARRKTLAKLGISTVRDLLSHYPRRYIDLTDIRPLASASIGESCAVVGQVVGVKLKRPRRNLPIVEVAVNDGTSTMIASFFRQPWIKDKVAEGDRVVMVGRIEFSYGYLRMSNPFMEVLSDGTADVRRLGLVPVHPVTSGITPVQLRAVISSALSKVRGVYDPIPLDLRLKRRLYPRARAIEGIHFPLSGADRLLARRRLVYEELLLMQLFLMMPSYNPDNNGMATAHVTDGRCARTMLESLPFALTGDQQAALSDILGSLASPRATSRLLLGDVGTGKTIVAALAMAAVADNGRQSLMMAPTEVLARQHFETLSPLFEEVGVKSALLTGSTDRESRGRMLRELAEGKIDVLIGTHALLEDDVRAPNMSFAVIDEQQRFGVGQRAKLIAKGPGADALYMTATPIPRSLARAIFGGLELSYIKERPADVSNRTTTVLSRDERGAAYEAAVQAVSRGEQVYVVCPLIGIGSEERDDMASGGQSGMRADEKAPTEDENATRWESDAASDDSDTSRAASRVVIDDFDRFDSDNSASAKKEAEFLQRNIFTDGVVGLLHGGMPSDEKKAVMDAFRNGEIDVLVSTTVIEVGVDVPNATVMIIEDADRFGLSQLHQLRGRIGRGGLPSRAFLVSASASRDALDRLAKLEQTDDGFEISEFDLSLRREGDLLGYRQSGKSALKLVDIIRDAPIIEQAHEDAKSILETDPLLEMPQNKPLSRELHLRFDEDASFDGG